jgi:TetR/AcrR family transcriptional regulator, cholesterol catabolism regulator
MRTNPPPALNATAEPSARKQHLLQAAAQVFDARGYKAATLRQIADEAGILAGSVYHHVESKEALYLEVHRTGYLRMQAAVQRALDGHGDPWTRLEVACRAHLEEMLGGDPIARVTGQGLMEPRDGPVHVALGPLRGDYELLWARLVEALPLAEGRGIDRRVLRLNLIGALNWTRTWYRADGALKPAELAAQLVGMLRR